MMYDRYIMNEGGTAETFGPYRGAACPGVFRLRE